MIIQPSFAQENAAPATPPLYSIDGDEVFIESDDSGSTHFYAEGNAVLNYITDGASWTLEADVVQFVGEKNTVGRIIPLLAHAAGNISLTGPTITVTAPGSIEVNIAERWVISDSENIHLIFEDGDLITDFLEIHETILDDGVIETVVDTDISTIAILQLSDIISSESDNISQANIFSSLKFDFSKITIETTKIKFILVDNRPSELDCPERTIVRTDRNTLIMPVAGITFDPNTLEGPEGVELMVGEDTKVTAGYIYLEYPPEGGMNVDFLGCPPGATLAAYSAASPRVTITNPVGTFTASSIKVTVNPDGTNRVVASGRACFEIPMDIMGIPRDNPLEE